MDFELVVVSGPVSESEIEAEPESKSEPEPEPELQIPNTLRLLARTVLRSCRKSEDRGERSPRPEERTPSATDPKGLM